MHFIFLRPFHKCRLCNLYNTDLNDEGPFSSLFIVDRQRYLFGFISFFVALASLSLGVVLERAVQ